MQVAWAATINNGELAEARLEVGRIGVNVGFTKEREREIDVFGGQQKRGTITTQHGLREAKAFTAH